LEKPVTSRELLTFTAVNLEDNDAVRGTAEERPAETKPEIGTLFLFSRLDGV